MAAGAARPAPAPHLVQRFADDLTAALGHSPGDDEKLALAVSGGPDSMAMLALAAAAFPRRVIAATVDHRLRAASAAEAAMVGDYCASIGVPHATMLPDQPITGASMQSAARAARYALLGSWAVAAGATSLLTAHHADDQAETFMMRAARGSGLGGLAAIRARRPLLAGTASPLLVRPLLGWRRTDLRAIAVEIGVPFVDDPSNVDDRYDRVRFRALLADNPWLDSMAVASSARHLAEAEQSLLAFLDQLWAERTTFSETGLSVDCGGLPADMRRRIVRRAITTVRDRLGIDAPAWAEAMGIEPLLDALLAGKSATQAGVLVQPKGTIWRFTEAPARRSH